MAHRMPLMQTASRSSRVFTRKNLQRLRFLHSNITNKRDFKPNRHTRSCLSSKVQQFSAVPQCESQYESFEFLTNCQENFSYLQKTFSKILIANRGEIAVRIIKTCRKMGIRTVAVFSEAEEKALHVRLADETFCIGPAIASQSYLNVNAILEVVKKTGAQAVHPGYGFLSENGEFCKALEEIGVEFIGPKYQSIYDMGDKLRSKEIAIEAGVSTIPGFKGILKDAAHACELSRGIGYPIMLKASAGGGGKGMRIAYSDEEVHSSFDIAVSESQKSFGDPRLLLEKYIEEPRHIEIQIIGDKFGNVIYLPERECSIQRRNQKVIEEAPSTFLDQSNREEMGQLAVSLAKRVKYFSAGTVEFLVDKHKNIYFLEMNTRLQVEHPITELITNVDLVEWMILVAAGKPLPIVDQSIMNQKRNGWAIECRVYAEDPTSYLPCVGKLSRYQEPPTGWSTALANNEKLENSIYTRCDSGIDEGSDISIHYDPMICKLSTFGSTRESARLAMLNALDNYVITGVVHNIPLLREILIQDSFLSGNINTGFLPTFFPKGFQGHLLNENQLNMALSASAILHMLQETSLYTSTISSKSVVITFLKKKYYLLVNAALQYSLEYSISFLHHESPEKKSSLFDNIFQFKLEKKNDNSLFLLKSFGNDLSSELTFQMVPRDLSTKSCFLQTIRAFGSEYDFHVCSLLEDQLAGVMPPPKVIDTSKLLISPMPGSISKILVNVGDNVLQGGELVVIEAMKMQNVLRSTKSGKIRAIHVSSGATVAAKDILLELE